MFSLRLSLEAHQSPEERIEKLDMWHNDFGILVIGFGMFRQLTINNKLNDDQCLLATAALQIPGPDILIVDEGTVAKNPEVTMHCFLIFPNSHLTIPSEPNFRSTQRSAN